MSKHHAVCIALVTSVLAPLLQGAAAPPKQQLGEIVGDDVYTNCEYRVAAQFPNEPKFRDGAGTAPARQFYFERPIGPLSVTVVHFSDGLDVDKQAINNAAETLRRRGEVRFDFPVFYDDAVAARIPGRQLQIALSDGHFLNGSVYSGSSPLRHRGDRGAERFSGVAVLPVGFAYRRERDRSRHQPHHAEHQYARDQRRSSVAPI